MTTSMRINSETYWDKRFEENWENSEGPRQSRFFAQLALENLPDWLFDQIRQQELSVADWGCAQGDGTDVLASYMNNNQLNGIDFSSIAIEQAKKRYPGINFFCQNWLEAQSKQRQVFDVVFSSNTLEHFDKPYQVLTALANRARKAVVLALPYRELERIDEHFFSFLPNNIPTELSNGFRLIWSRVIDCSTIPNTLWGGDQIFLIYAEPSWIKTLKLTLFHVEVDKNDNTSIQASLAAQVAEREAQINNLNQVVVEREAQINNLSQAVVEREAQINNLNQAVVEREAQINNLNQAVVERDRQFGAVRPDLQDKEIFIAMLKAKLEKTLLRINQKKIGLITQLKRLPYYFSRIIAIQKSSGLTGLQEAISLKLSRRLAGNTNSYIQPQVSAVHIPCDAKQNPPSPLTQPLLGDSLVIITGVPFDDVGGGQRAAQIARCALRSGRNVIYIYMYKKFDFELNQYVDSVVTAHGLTHLHIGATSPLGILKCISPDATLLIELPHKDAIPYLELFNSRGMRTVFELIDDWESSLGGDWFNMDIYRRFVKESSVTIGTARVLVQKLRDQGCDHAIYLPNAANEYIFDKYKNFSRPSDMPNGYRRIALYFGSLYGEWFAWDYIHEAATKNPDIAFVLIGDRPNRTHLSHLPRNIHFLGSKQIEDLPAYLVHADLSLLPFSPGKISDAVSPIKVFEYLFSGSPVVATNLPEVIDYPGVSVAGTPEEFSDLCRDVVFSEEQNRKNDSFIFNNSWFSRLDKIVSSACRSKFMNSVSAIILIHNNKPIIGRCLESLLLHCNSYLKEIIVVDNASTDGGADFVEMNFPTVCVIRNIVNGCSSGRNLGARSSTGKFLAFFDSDQWFTSSSGFEEALTILSRDANAGVVGWAAGWFEAGREDLGGMIADYCPNRAMDHIAIERGYRSDIGYLGTGGLFIPKSIFDATEGFDVNYDPTCFEDTDLSFQIKKLGLDICYRDLTGIRHQPHQTTQASSGSNTYAILFRRNATYFKKKWCNHPNFFTDYKR